MDKPIYGRVNRNPLAEQVATIIRDTIINGGFKPGERLVGETIAKKIGVSRAPVREAICLLEREGVVEYIPNKGAFVRSITAKDIVEIYTLRSVLEGLAVKLTVERITAEEISKLTEICEVMHKAAEEGNESELIHLDLRFHRLIIHYSQHSYLERIFSEMSNLLLMYLMVDTEAIKAGPGLMQQYIEHNKILEAIKARESEKAEKWIKRHVEASGKSILSYMAGDDFWTEYFKTLED